MDLQVQKRESLGKAVKELRAKGFIPAELYGKGVKNIHLAVSKKEFKKIFKEAGENTIVNILIDREKHPVLIQDVNFDVITDDFLNIDFYQVRMDEKVKIEVPLEFIGVSPAVKTKNGLFVKALSKIEVEALPSDIPHSFQVDISVMEEIGQSIYVKSLKTDDKVKILVSPDTVVATVTTKVTEEEELAMQKEAGVEMEGVKVESEEKKAERETMKAAEASVETKEVKEIKETPKK